MRVSTAYYIINKNGQCCKLYPLITMVKEQNINKDGKTLFDDTATFLS